MRVFQLLENHNFSQLKSVWTGSLMVSLIEQLKHMGEDEAMLAHFLERAIEKGAAAEPEKIFNFIKPLVDASHHTEAKGSVHSYLSVLTPFLNHFVLQVLRMDPAPVKLLQSKISINYLANHIDPELAVKLRLGEWKVNRTKEEEKIDDENQLYVFVGRKTFKEKEDGSGDFRKTLEIERLVPIDRFDSKSHQMVGMMKLRARVQGEGSEVYSIQLPKGVVDDVDDLDDWLIDLIDTHKKKVS